MYRTLLDSQSLADVAPLGITPSWVVMISAVIFVIYMTFRPKRRDPLAMQPFRSSLTQQKSLERDMQSVIVELSEMTRQMSAQLETRAAALEQLIRDADAKIAELEQAREAASRVNTASENAAGEFTAIASDTISPATNGTRPAMRLVSEDTSHSEDRWAEVYRLGDEGLTLPEIARRLARPNGEVELILALRPKSTAPAIDRPTPLPADLVAAQ